MNKEIYNQPESNGTELPDTIRIQVCDKYGTTYESECVAVSPATLGQYKFENTIYRIDTNGKTEVFKKIILGWSILRELKDSTISYMINNCECNSGFYAYLEDTSNSRNERIRFTSSKPSIVPVEYIQYEDTVGMKINGEVHIGRYDNDNKNIEFLTYCNINYGKVVNTKPEAEIFIKESYDDMVDVIKHYSQSLKKISEDAEKDAVTISKMKNEYLKTL